MADAAFQQAQRSQKNFLADREKRLLIWIARRLPAWVNSDHLTGLGFVSLLAAGGCYLAARRNMAWLWVAIPCLALNWFGDSLDGTVARVRKQQRPRYGFYIDHILDAIGTFFLMAGIGFSGILSPAVAAVFLIFYLLLSIEIYLATYTLGTFHMSYWSLGPTELRILLVIGNLVALLRGPWATIAGRKFLLFDIGFSVGAAALALILLQASVRHTVALYREETKR